MCVYFFIMSNRKRKYNIQGSLDYFEEALEKLCSRVDSLPDPLTTKQEKQRLKKDIRFLKENLKEFNGHVEELKREEGEFFRCLLTELKKERIDVRPTQGLPLQTVPWALGRVSKSNMRPPLSKKKKTGGNRK